MSVVQSAEPVIMSFTDNAAKKVHSLIAEEGNDKLKLRVFVTGGGCSGFQYGFSFDESVNEDDTVISNNGADLLVDPLSYQYLVGAKIDYVEGLEGSRFVVDNPMASTTCGCGASFSI
ncbi:MAG: iron-sulfur cluster insertion protein ErpA [Pseudomonadales bacterium]|nr:iron-sulfur cluster insertion protein ErpA [Pseudomonadales bacterium]